MVREAAEFRLRVDACVRKVEGMGPADRVIGSEIALQELLPDGIRGVERSPKVEVQVQGRVAEEGFRKLHSVDVRRSLREAKYYLNER